MKHFLRIVFLLAFLGMAVQIGAQVFYPSLEVQDFVIHGTCIGCVSSPTLGARDFYFNFISDPSLADEIQFVMIRGVKFPANFVASGFSATSVSKVASPATVSKVFSIQKDGVQVATATCGIGATTCTFSSQAGFSINTGHTLSIVPPTHDATLANVSFTLGGEIQ